KDGRDAHPTITIKIVSYLIRDPNTIDEYDKLNISKQPDALRLQFCYLNMAVKVMLSGGKPVFSNSNYEVLPNIKVAYKSLNF
ncbi:hypothetical protein QUB69_35755, partial [Microcoleus sp. AT13-A6]